jgi:hypothetical protein
MKDNMSPARPPYWEFYDYNAIEAVAKRQEKFIKKYGYTFLVNGVKELRV